MSKLPESDQPIEAARPKQGDAAQGLRLPVSERRLLLALGDLTAVFVAVLGALRVWALVGRVPFVPGFVLSQAHWFFLMALLWGMLAAANNFYDLALTARWARSQVRLGQITLQLVVVYLLIFFLSPRDALPRLFILYYAVLSYALIALWRLGRPFLIGWVPLKRRVLIVGAGWAAQTMIEAIAVFAPDDYDVAGVVAQDEEGAGIVPESARLGQGRDLARLAGELQASEIILAASENLDGETFQAIMDCHERGVSITSMPILYERLTGMVPVEHVGGHWNVVLPLEARSPFDPYPLLKRLMDISLSLIGLLGFGLLLPLLALLIRLDSPGPIFYRQERVGKAGRVYWLTKLRSMTQDAETQRGPLWAVADDPRVTRVGRLMRKTRLDELPQLWNVLIGEMSVIGPRPERPYFVERLQRAIPFYRTRLTVQPGLTGWAQVNHGYGSSEKDALIKLKYDLYYIRHRSVLLDALILLRTVAKVIRMQGT
jgi:exopolysaccharide biosynthesis polyprenyl glycosylphosphotransferase